MFWITVSNGMDLKFLVTFGEQFLQALKESSGKVKENICKRYKSRANACRTVPAGKTAGK
jgi:hypothetical protein